MYISLLCILTLPLVLSKSLDELCFNDGKINNCICDFVTDNVTHLPEISVDCSRIGLKEDPARSKTISTANSLDLSHNQITALINQFISTTLEAFILCHNKIATINDNYFQFLPSLEVLDLSFNRISNIKSNLIFSGLKSLKRLDLSYNDLTTLPDNVFFPLQSLVDLNLGYNNLGALLMSHQKMLTLKLGVDTKLEKLNLDNTNLSNFHNSYFDDFHQLKRLSLADNPLPDIPQIAYSVTDLDLSGTNITTLAARHLNYHSLKVLRLNRLRELRMIDKYAFYNLQSLEELSINDCKKLKSLNDLVFGIVSKHADLPLKKLSIARTGLQTLNVTYAYLFEKLDEIDLQHNHWKCDCDLLWLQKFESRYTNTNHMRCIYPYSVIYKRIMELKPEDVHCKVAGSGLYRVLMSILIAVIGVLICLIVYLIYMGPKIYRNRFRGIGPLSPYGMVTTQP